MKKERKKEKSSSYTSSDRYRKRISYIIKFSTLVTPSVCAPLLFSLSLSLSSPPVLSLPHLYLLFLLTTTPTPPIVSAA